MMYWLAHGIKLIQKVMKNKNIWIGGIYYFYFKDHVFFYKLHNILNKFHGAIDLQKERSVILTELSNNLQAFIVSIPS